MLLVTKCWHRTRIRAPRSDVAAAGALHVCASRCRGGWWALASCPQKTQGRIARPLLFACQLYSSSFFSASARAYSALRDAPVIAAATLAALLTVNSSSRIPSSAS